MEYMQINLENYGGFDVEFQLRKSEFQARVNDAAELLKENPRNFKKQLNWAFGFVHKNITYFSSADHCEGPQWDLFREELVDSISMNYAMTYKDKHLVTN